MITAIVPVKALSLAKGRLSRLLTPNERQALVVSMLGDVLTALSAAQHIQRIGVISVDPAILALANQYNVDMLEDQTTDLNAALTQAARHYYNAGATATLVLPADLPLITPQDIDQLIAARTTPPGVLIAPSRDGGTNALLTWPPLALPFRFGQGSLALHIASAREYGLEIQQFQSAGFDLDVDQPEDLLLLAESAGETATQRLARELCVAERVMCV